MSIFFVLTKGVLIILVIISYRCRNVRKAFTLIELLVVIAIIMILMALLFPVFSSAKESAKRVTCFNNMKQLSYGLIMYTSDYEGVYLGYSQQSFTGDNTPSTTTIWSGMIQPYVKSKQIFACPSAGIFKEAFGDTWITRGQQSIGLNIHTGKWLSNDNIIGADHSPMRLNESTMEYPYKNLLFADSVNGDTQLGYKGYIVSNWDYHDRCGSPTAINAIGRSFSNRHNKTTNVAFADAHAKNFPYKGLMPNISRLDTDDCRCIADSNPLRIKWAVTLKCLTDSYN